MADCEHLQGIFLARCLTETPWKGFSLAVTGSAFFQKINSRECLVVVFWATPGFTEENGP
ncbi:MAG: hypothetical protein GX443_18730 [Deltaproteobacteria bacterium]|nr:hypothetical protein [Deltaproteobacteria bacterium]